MPRVCPGCNSEDTNEWANAARHNPDDQIEVPANCYGCGMAWFNVYKFTGKNTAAGHGHK